MIILWFGVREEVTMQYAPDFIKTLGDKYKKVSVCVSKNLITANGPMSAMEFSLKICEYLGINPNF